MLNLRTTEKLMEGWRDEYKTKDPIEEVAAKSDVNSLFYNGDQMEVMERYFWDVFTLGKQKG